MVSAREYLWARVIPEPNSGCWLWVLDVNQWGYGRGTHGRGERAAHRLAYRAFKGDIPHGLVVMHSCDQPSCVNPDHLFLGTLANNAQDMVRKGRNFVARGERSGMAKLTWAAAQEIRADDISTVSDMARRFGVSRRAISFVLEGHTWRPLS